jgi:hypothetical protein
MRVPRIFWMTALSVVAGSLQADEIANELSAAQREKVKDGGQVMVTQELKGYPWPKTRVYQVVNATPSEVMAVFFDYDAACGYIPNCTKSRISKIIDARTCEIDYEVAVPVVADEAYTVRNTLSGQGLDRLRIAWTMLKSRNAESSEGSMAVEPFEGRTLLRYTNLVKPNSGIAGILKGFALGQMRDAVLAIANEVESRKRTNPRDLDAQVSRLAEALGHGG